MARRCTGPSSKQFRVIQGLLALHVGLSLWDSWVGVIYKFVFGMGGGVKKIKSSMYPGALTHFVAWWGRCNIATK